MFRCDSDILTANVTETMNQRRMYQVVLEKGEIQLRRDFRLVAKKNIRLVRGFGPLLLGTTLVTLDQSGATQICRPAGMLLGRMYSARFGIGDAEPSTFRFSQGLSIHASDHRGFSFSDRQAAEFEFQIEKTL